MQILKLTRYDNHEPIQTPKHAPNALAKNTRLYFGLISDLQEQKLVSYIL